MFKRLAFFVGGFGLILSSFFFSSFSYAQAQTDINASYNKILDQGIIFANMPGCDAQACPCRESGNCTLEQIEQLIVNISTLILALVGSIVLLMFIYGGIVWITSNGEPGRVDIGKRTVTNAVIGLAIVLGAYAIMTFVIAAVTGVDQGQTLEDTVNDVIQGAPQTP